MPQSILNRIVASKKGEVARKKKILPLDKLKMRLDKVAPPRDFKASVFFKQGVSIIAEIKRFSPSRGVLIDNLNPSQLARLYKENGASAVSVLIDHRFFAGSLEDLGEVKKATSLPVLAKEFILDEYQVYEARLHGADAILLIADLLGGEELLKFHQLAQSLGMSCIIEVHSTQSTGKIPPSFSSLIVGINNRNLKNFQVDLATTERILDLIPPSSFIISESGIRGPEDIKMLKEKGVGAFLVGEAILRSSNPARELRELCNG